MHFSLQKTVFQGKSWNKINKVCKLCFFLGLGLWLGLSKNFENKTSASQFKQVLFSVSSQEKEFTGRMEKNPWDTVFSEVTFEMLPGQLLQGKEALKMIKESKYQVVFQALEGLIVSESSSTSYPSWKLI